MELTSIYKKKGAQQHSFQWALAFMASLEHSTHSVNKNVFQPLLKKIVALSSHSSGFILSNPLVICDDDRYYHDCRQNHDYHSVQ